MSDERPHRPLFDAPGSAAVPYAAGTGTYEAANWAKLSPAAREAHNRLRQSRGEAPIPPPAVDLYVPPSAPTIRPVGVDKEAAAAARQFMGPRLMAPGDEGFTINGQPAKW